MIAPQNEPKKCAYTLSLLFFLRILNPYLLLISNRSFLEKIMTGSETTVYVVVFITL